MCSINASRCNLSPIQRVIALNWTDKIRIIGLLGAVCGGVIQGIWLLLHKISVKGRDVHCSHFGHAGND